jgi:hypothetical protein
MSPLEELAVGSSCGFVGASPRGRDATLTLRSAGRVDLLRNVLRGPNPGARVYAAKALTKLGALRPEDANVVKSLTSASTRIVTCSGCMFMTGSSAEAFQTRVD